MTLQVDEKSRAFAEQTARAHLALVLSDLMHAAGLDSKALAERIYATGEATDSIKYLHKKIDQILNADASITINMLGWIAALCGVRLKISFVGTAR